MRPSIDTKSVEAGRFSVLGATTFIRNTLTVSDSLRSLHGRSGTLPPPYLAVAAVEPKGNIRKLWLKGVWTDGLHIAFVDSVTERRSFARFRAKELCFFKPLLEGDISHLTAFLPPQSSELSWRCRPDLIVWCPSSSDPNLAIVVEVRGFKPGDDPEYDRQIETKERFYRGLGQGWSYHEEHGWKYPRTELPDPKIGWQNPPLIPGGFSPLARDAVVEQLGSLV